MEIIILASAAVLTSIIAAYFFVKSVKNSGEGENKVGEKAQKFLNVTENKSSHFVRLLNNSSI
ncbi:hypothetical protein Mefer_1290 [Methanocaldococcus fervens AG86]|uniref:Uncharacterized protein n=2 Tax=Methanocaldococcus TaxID=196118 RepID=C7P967_METFA|nr:hypothetical protein Mefer_1290 [Methanocaldococcus fervens AG86]